MEQISKNDYILLKYISEFQVISIEKVNSHFKHKLKNTSCRMEILHKNGYIVSCEKIIDDYKNIRIDTDIFKIAPLGEIALQDYVTQTKLDIKMLWVKNAWIPILVSFVTTNVTMYLIPKLPLILKWLCGILSKILS